MNRKFEYYINKTLNTVLLQLMSFILFTAILIVLTILFSFKIGPYSVPIIYIFTGIILFFEIIIHYISYRRNIWLLSHYKDEEDKVISLIKKYKNDDLTYGMTSYLFYVFNKKALKYYDEAIKCLIEKKVEKHA